MGCGASAECGRGQAEGQGRSSPCRGASAAPHTEDEPVEDASKPMQCSVIADNQTQSSHGEEDIEGKDEAVGEIENMNADIANNQTQSSHDERNTVKDEAVEETENMNAVIANNQTQSKDEAVEEIENVNADIANNQTQSSHDERNTVKDEAVEETENMNSVIADNQTQSSHGEEDIEGKDEAVGEIENMNAVIADTQTESSHDERNTVKDDAVEETENMNDTNKEPEDVSLAFDSFLHNSGNLYTCFNEHGIRVYLDEAKGLIPFPDEWYNEGRFLNGAYELVSNHCQAPPSGCHLVNTEPNVLEDGRAGGLYIPGKGMVMTYMLEERANVCRYFDASSGTWLLLPLQWEMNLDFVRERVERVMGVLPGLVDEKEIVGALRQCNYDSDEVIFVYLSTFGDILLQPPEGVNSTDANSFRSYMEKDRIIEDLEQKLQDKEKEMDDLVQKNNYLSEEYRYLSEDLQPLYGRVAELEADKEEASEKIRALLATRPTGPDADLAPKPSVNSSQLLQVGTLIRDLNIANKSLRSTVKHMFSEMGHQMEQLLKAALRMKEAQQNSTTDFEELRSLYRREAMERKALYNKLQELCGNIRVFCRCRGDSAADTCLDVPSDEEVIVNQKGSKKTFFFDKVYPSSATQEEVFNEARAIITSCVDGYNVCILAYGQTGSGKTYTMMGPKGNPGVNIRSIRELLHICKQRETITYVLKISMLEIYNESLNDLLALNQTSQLEIQTRGKAVTVHGLTQIEVNTEDDILNIVELGEQNRTTASTKINIESSRSHLIVTLHVDGTDSASGVTSHGSLMLCDLAGSERISKTEATGQRLVEAAAINKSLTSLGQVFSALKCNALHVPFRNSKLTRLLQPSLSGDAKACVFLNVSPDMNNLAETLSTLQFGSSIRQVELGRATQHTSPGRDTQ